jgi:succinate-semialdehyde dehydrogenase / glutarate-semialdehyde dehydrogenase
MSTVSAAIPSIDTIDVTNPATGRIVQRVEAIAPGAVRHAIDAAADHQTRWAALAPRARSEILRACWQILLDHRHELAALIVSENGKPHADADLEVAYAAEFFRWNAEEAVRIHGTIGNAPGGDNRVIVHRVPVGVVGVIAPWNFPAAMITRKLAPALAAGNAAVVKPASETPLTALRILELMRQAGLPDGLVAVQPSASARTWLDTVVDHPETRMISFTGSTEVGRAVLRRCADRVLKVGMELGGNAPFVVFDDADVSAAVAGAMTAKMRHSAQTCTAANRFYVHEDVAEQFTDELTTAMAAVVPGPGDQPDSTCGPLINSGAIDRVHSLVTRALDDGATATTGGTPIARDGCFYAPTVLADVAPTSAIVDNEIFGPVAPIITFSEDDDLIEMANSTELGLAAYVFTTDLGRGLAVSERLASGMVGLNRGALSDPAAPFGGMRQSGLGREGGSDGIHEFCEIQYIATQW